MSCTNSYRQIDSGGMLFHEFSGLPDGLVAVDWHSHKFPHALIVMAGELDVSMDVAGVETTVRVKFPDIHHVSAAVPHKIVSRMDGTMFRCAIPHRDKDGAAINFLGPKESYE